MTTTQRIQPLVSIKQACVKIMKCFSIVFAIYTILVTYVLLAHFITTPEIAKLLSISDESVIKLRSLESYYNDKISHYIAQDESAHPD